MNEDGKCTNKDVEQLMRNAYFGEIDKIKKKIALGLNVNIVDGVFGNTPLLLAVAAENEEAVDVLLQNGASPDLANSRTGETPLMRAVERDNEVITRLLLRADCDLTATNNKGETAFDLAKPDRLAQLQRAVHRRQKERFGVLRAFACLAELADKCLDICWLVQSVKRFRLSRVSECEHVRED